MDLLANNALALWNLQNEVHNKNTRGERMNENA